MECGSWCLFCAISSGLGASPWGGGAGVRQSAPLTWAHQPTLSGQTLEHIYW